MDPHRIAVVGIGATGAVLAAALLSRNPETMLVVRRKDQKESLQIQGITVSGELSYQVRVGNVFEQISDLKKHEPTLVFVCSKTFHLPAIIDALKGIFRPGMKIVSTHNGLGTEDVFAETFGTDAVFRMTLNYGVMMKASCHVATAFFNRPNYLGALVPQNRQLGDKIASLLTAGGLDTECVDDIKFYVWKKMIMKCTMASICAVTDKTIKGALEFPPTREIAEGCFKEVLAIAEAKGYALGEDYLKTALAYLEKVGIHKDSMCVDIANRTPTEIEFLGGKVVEYGKETGISTPYYSTMVNLVRAMESNYLAG
jgi:2-dehydropantoate 2-reductase